MNLKQLRKAIRQKRLDLVYRQAQLTDEFCSPCEKRTNSMTVCRGCDVFTQLKEIGNELLSISNESQKLRKEQKTMSETKLTVEVYKDLKAKGLSNTKIMKQFNMNNSKFYEWKRNNGLIEKKVTLSKQETTSSNENSKPKDGEHLMRENEQMQNEMKNLSQELIKLRDEKDDLMKSNAGLREEKAILRSRLTEVEEEYEKLHDLKHELTKNIEKANEIIEDLREENERLKSISERGEYYMKLSFMLMEGVVRELKEDAN